MGFAAEAPKNHPSSWPSFTQACHRAADALSQLNGLDGDQMGSIHGEQNEDFRKQNGGFHGIYTAWWCNNHLEKYEFVNGKDDNPYIMENKTCSKPPIRYEFMGIKWDLNHHI
jgi:hypothetical protein